MIQNYDIAEALNFSYRLIFSVFQRHSTYSFFLFVVSSVVSSLFEWMQNCIQRFRGRNDEKILVFKGGWFFVVI